MSSIVPIVEREAEDSIFLWLRRAHQVSAPNVRLIDLVRLDERVEAHIDALRVAGPHAWTPAQEPLEKGEAGAFFNAGILAIESGHLDAFEGIIERAYEAARRTEGEPYEPAYDPWRGLVSALAWVDQSHAARAVDLLSRTPRPRTRWLGI